MPPGQTELRQRGWRSMLSSRFAALAAVLILGAGIRTAYLLEIVHAPDFYYPTMIDSDYQDDWARGLLTGNWKPINRDEALDIPNVTYFRPPGYPYFLAVVYALFGSSYLTVRIVQMCIGILSGILAYCLGRRWFGSVVGVLLALFMSLYWVFIFYEGELHAPSLLVFLGLAVLWALARGVEACGFWRAILAGVLLGAFAVIRPNILVFVPFVLGWFWWIGRGRWSLRGYAKAVSGFLVGATAAVLPVTIRNYAVSGEWVLISSNAGVTLLCGNNPATSATEFGFIPDLPDLAGMDGWTTYDYPKIVEGLEKKLGRPLKRSEVSRYFAQQALAYVRAHPLEWLRLMGDKVAVLWGPIERDATKELHYARKESTVLRHLPGGFAAVLAMAVLGAALLACDLRRAGHRTEDAREAHAKQRHVSLLLLLYLAAYTASFLPFTISTRYRVPVVPVLLLLGAYGLSRAVQYGRNRRYHMTALCVLAWTGLYALARISLVGYEPEPGRWHQQRAIAYTRSSQMDRALSELRTVIRLEPNRAKAHSDLGSALLKVGRPAEAAVSLTKALQLNPGSSETQVDLAIALAEQDKIDEAVRCFAAAIRQHKNKAEAHTRFATALGKRGRLNRAIAHLERAVQIKPDYPEALGNLGVALIKTNRASEAVAILSKAVRLDPRFAEARVALGTALLAQGKSDKGIEELSAAVRLNPNLPNAHNNLAGALLQKGDVDRAIRHLAEALRCRPNWIGPLGSLAWIYATYEGPDLPRPAAAVALAERACTLTNHRHPLLLDTLAAAYAAAGRFDDAVAAAQRALALASSARGTQGLAAQIRERLQLYQSGQAYRMPRQPGPQPTSPSKEGRP